MEGTRPVSGSEGIERFVYFVIRIRRGPREVAVGPSGLLERLGSGRTRPFEGARDLLELLDEGVEEASSSPRRSSGD